MARRLQAGFHGRFGFFWFTRAPAHIRGGRVFLDLSRREWVELESPPFIELATIRTPEDVLRFVSAFGLLECGDLLESHGMFRKPNPSETVLSILKTARDALFVIRGSKLLDRATSGDADCVARYRQLMLLRARSRKPSSRRDAKEIADFARSVKTCSDEQLLMDLRKQIDDTIQSQIRGTEAGFGYDQNRDDWQFEMLPANLRAWCFIGIATMIKKREVVGICRRCDSVFRVVDPRQQFCGKSCAARDRYLRMKARRAI